MYLIKAILRIFFFMPLAVLILPLPTLYMAIRNTGKVPLIDAVFGCTEDGSGNGDHPDNPRQFWSASDGTKQGWYPNRLGIDWHTTNLFKRWYHIYVWLAWRNVCWNLRLRSWFGESIHVDDIRVITFEEGEGEGRLREATYEWYNFDRKKRFMKRRKFLGVFWEYGYEFYPNIFRKEHPEYKATRTTGYTTGVLPFKQYSIPSIRPRRNK